MAWGKRLHCHSCNAVWDVLLMSKDDPLPDCPNCTGVSRETLAAPRIGRGATPETQLKIPDNKTKAIDTALRWASEDNGGVNIRTDAKPGEAVYVPVKQDPALPQGVGGFYKAGAPIPGVVPISVGAVEERQRNLGILGSMQKAGNPIRPIAKASMKDK